MRGRDPTVAGLERPQAVPPADDFGFDDGGFGVRVNDCLGNDFFVVKNHAEMFFCLD